MSFANNCFGLCKHVYTVSPPSTFRLWRIVVSHKYYRKDLRLKKSFSIYNYLFRVCFFIRFSMIICFVTTYDQVATGGLKWTRTTDLALIRRAL